MTVLHPARAGPMRTARSRALAVLWVIPVLLGAGPPAHADGLRRFALLAGNDQGGPDTKPLLYAAQDARRMHTVLTELGGVRPADAVLLLNQTAQELLSALGKLEVRIAEAVRGGQRTALIVYYSGHAKEGALRLGKTRLPLEALKQRLATLSSAHVRLGIFDACRSGVVTRTKGARKGPAFDVRTEGAQATRGLVLLTSSSADEESQESDAIGGSYFSHHLLSGLRGGADRSGDGRVTLAEAYEYAYARTVAETADTAAGAQHPSFSYDLKGNGDLILTDLAGGREGLRLPAAAPAGGYFLIDGDKGIIIAEVWKPAGVARTVALSPGRYKVKRRLADRLRVGEVRIAPGQVLTLEEQRLRDAPFADDPVKGARPRPVTRYGLGLGAGVQSFFDAPVREGLFPPTGMLVAELLVRDFFRRHWIWGLDLALGGSRATLVREAVDIELPFRFSELNLGTSLFVEWPLAGGLVVPSVGGRLAFLFMTRTFEGPDATIPAQFFSTFSPGLQGGLRVRLGLGLSLGARARLHYLHYNVGENRSLGYWELASGLAYDF
jgi:hypothetical protein